jgi:hypothetical protein
MTDTTLPGENGKLPDSNEIDWGPTQRSLDDGEPCPECGYEFGDDWDVNDPSLLARHIRASLPEGGALMWTPGNQSPATGRGPSPFIIPPFIRTSTGASAFADLGDERRLCCRFRA